MLRKTAVPILLVALSTPSSAGPVVGLGELSGFPPNWPFRSAAHAVSDDGQVVVGQAHSTEGLEAFRWTRQTGMVGLGDHPDGDFGSTASGLSADGSIVIGQVTTGASQQLQSYRWTESTGFQLLGVLAEDVSLPFSRATGISADGTIIAGTSRTLLGNEPFIYSESTGLTGLGTNGVINSSSGATDISSDGSVIVGSLLSPITNRSEAFRWTESGGIEGLGTLEGGTTGSSATAISGNGKVIVGNSSVAASSNEVFYWTEATGMQSLGRFPGTDEFIFVHDTNYDGSIIVGAIGSSPYGGRDAVVWDPERGFRDLNDILLLDYGVDLEGWHLEEANGVSADGQWIVGMGINPAGFREAFLVNVPEPSSLVIWTIGAAVMTGAHLAHRKRERSS